MDLSTWYWISLIVSLAVFWSLDAWLAQFHATGQNVAHGVNNILIATINTLITFGLAAGAAGMIYLVESHELGIMAALGFPLWLKVVIGFLWVDFLFFGSHYLKHRWNWLWRLHLVHHSDTQIDATTVFRQHPGEAVISFVLLTGTTALLGIPSFAVLLFYVAANPLTVLQHANIRIPDSLDRRLSYLINTPNMHKVHHLVDVEMSNSNYGYFLSIWDRCFGTFTAPAEQMQWNFGIAEYTTEESTHILDLLIAPLESGKTAPDSVATEPTNSTAVASPTQQ